MHHTFIQKTCAIFTIFCLSVSSAFAAIQPGETAPDFTLTSSKGEAVNLSSLKGQIIVLEWLNYECPFSKMHYTSKNLPTLQETYTQKDVVWLSIASSAPGKQGYFTADQYAEQNTQFNSHASHVLLDPTGDIAKLYGAKTTPHIFIIDTEGHIAYNGAIDSIPSADSSTIAKATPYAEKAIHAVLAGKKADPDATRPYGCGIKYSTVEGYNK